MTEQKAIPADEQKHPQPEAPAPVHQAAPAPVHQAAEHPKADPPKPAPAPAPKPAPQKPVVKPPTELKKLNPIQILLHIGGIIKTGSDAEKTIVALIHHAPAGALASQTLADLATLVQEKVIDLPADITPDMVIAAIAELNAILPR